MAESHYHQLLYLHKYAVVSCVGTFLSRWQRRRDLSVNIDRIFHMYVMSVLCIYYNVECPSILGLCWHGIRCDDIDCCIIGDQDILTKLMRVKGVECMQGSYILVSI